MNTSAFLSIHSRVSRQFVRALAHSSVIHSPRIYSSAIHNIPRHSFRSFSSSSSFQNRISGLPPLHRETSISKHIFPTFRHARWQSSSSTTSGTSTNTEFKYGGPPDPSECVQYSDYYTKYDFKGTAFKMFESAATMFATVAILGLAGYIYHKYYKAVTLDKIANAFAKGDPVLDLVNPVKDKNMPESERFIERDEQDRVDAIVRGDDDTVGKYYLLIGEKGTGKTSMLLSAMQKIDGERCAMMEAHADAEIFRIRLGKCLDYEYHEDYIGSLFSIRGPRDTTALLDIERAFNKLEKFAIKQRKLCKKKGIPYKPLIFMVNSCHLIKNDAVGADTIELLQQRAESWAASGLVTMIFNSDDYWIYERFKPNLSRMEIIPITDLPRKKAIEALKTYRYRFYKEIPDDSVLEEIYRKVGGRLSFLYRITKTKDMLQKADQICEAEKTWFLNKCGLLGRDMDDDVMDQQKFASAAMVLANYLVQMEKEKQGETNQEAMDDDDHHLPELPLYRARQIMTRADFIQEYDHLNIFTIDMHARVRADSVPMMNAFREVCSEEGFQEYLEETLERIGDIESLGRTREITLKDLWYGGKYNFRVSDAKGRPVHTQTLEVSYGDREAEKEERKREEEEEEKKLSK